MPLFLRFTAFLSLILTATLSAATFYVAPPASGGNNSNPGTLAAPFATIQRAATAAFPGDTIFIRAGTYRETITPSRSGTAGSRITYQNYNDEIVTISGADVISPASWTLDSGSTYQAPLAANFFTSSFNQALQVFVDGEMVTLAKWPDVTTKTNAYPSGTAPTVGISFPAKSVTSSFVSKTRNNSANLTTGVVTDTSLPPKPAGFYDGAEIYFQPNNAGWSWIFSGAVTNVPANGNQITFTSRSESGKDFNQTVYDPASRYYLFNKKEFLDTPGEWWHDRANGQLYLWSPNSASPATSVVEVKKRDFAFNLTSRSHITIQGVRLFASSITTDSGSGGSALGYDSSGNIIYPWRGAGYLAPSTGIIIDGILAQYLNHFTDISGHFFLQWGTCTGIVLSGTGHTIRNSTIEKTAGNGIQLLGRDHTVFNNTLLDTAYAGTDASAVNTVSAGTGTDHVISYNTIRRTGRSGITPRSHANSNAAGGQFKARYHHNDISYFGLQDWDVGGFYVAFHDGQFVRIDHNLVSEGRGFISAGVYLDYTKNYIVHNNVVWNVEWGIKIHGHSDNENNTLVYHNTSSVRNLSSTPYGPFAIGNGSGNNNGTVLRNNLLTVVPSPSAPGYEAIGAGASAFSGAEITANLAWNGVANSSTDPRWVNAATTLDATGVNYTLQTGSAAINAGIPVGTYTRNGINVPPFTNAITGSAPDVGAYEFGVPAWTAGASLTRCAEPVASPLAGNYTSAVSVTLTTETPGATIRYTTDGSRPTSTTGTVYTGAFTLSSTTTVEFIAHRDDLLDSSVVSATYTITPLSPPWIYLPFADANNTPAVSLGLVTGVTGYSGSGTVQSASALAFANLASSGNGFATANSSRFFISLDTTLPVLAPYVSGGQIGGTGTGVLYVSWLARGINAQEGNTFEFRNSSSANVEATVAIGTTFDNAFIRAMSANALNSGIQNYSNSTLVPSVNTDLYVAKFTFGAGNATRVDVYVNQATEGTPEVSTTGFGQFNTLSFAKFGGAPAPSIDEIRIAGTYAAVVPTTSVAQTAGPVFNPAAGTYSSTQAVTITTATSGATIRYTTDGSTPTSSSGIVYSGPINVPSTVTLRALAYQSGLTDSSVTVAAYIISRPPTAPSDLAISTVASTTELTITWTDNANDETGFKIERSPNGSSGWTQIATTSANATSFADTGLTASSTYFYRVRATNTAGDSANTNVANATTSAPAAPAAPAAPTSLTATANSSSQITLNWSDNSSNETSFTIERSPNGTTGWSQIATATADATGFADTGITASTTYFYRVRATNAVGDSAYSNTANATTTTAPVGNLLAYDGFAGSTVFNGGNGWSGNWSNGINAGDNLNYGGLVTTGAGANVGQWWGGESNRSLSTAITSGIVWLSWVQTVGTAPTDFAQIRIQNGGSRAFTVGQHNDANTFKIYDGSFAVGANTGISITGTNFVAMSVDLATSVVNLYINPMGLGSGAAPSSLASATWDGPGSISGITGLRSVGPNDGGFAWDEVRIGTTWADVSPVPASPLTGLQTFRTTYALAANGTQDLLNPAGDGVQNLLKYAFNMLGTGTGQASALATPNASVLTAAGSAGLPLVGIGTGPDAGKLQITYIRRIASATPGITYAVEFSDALVTWTVNPSASVSVTNIDPTFERITVTDSAHNPAPAKRFVRVRVTLTN